MNSKAQERPLVTFLQFSYNLEHFIREAVEGAFAQTYSPLQIILSDDCSTDKTFEITRAMAAEYRGPHRVILNRTSRNLGISAHFNQAMRLAEGDLIVFAGGDDISLPERTLELTTEWLAADRPSGISSGVLLIDEKGNRLERTAHWAPHSAKMLEAIPKGKCALIFAEEPRFCLLGCSAAWTRHCWQTFGNLDPEVMTEDFVMTFRASLLNGLRVFDRKLVKYRIHSSNIWATLTPDGAWSPEDYKRRESRDISNALWLCAAYRNILRDLASPHLPANLTPTDKRTISESIERALDHARLRSRWWDLTFMQRVRNFRCTNDEELPVRFLRLLPLSIYARWRSKLSKLRRGSRNA